MNIFALNNTEAVQLFIVIVLGSVIASLLLKFSKSCRKPNQQPWDNERVFALGLRVGLALATLPAGWIVYQVLALNFEGASRNTSWLDWVFWILGLLLVTPMAFLFFWMVSLFVFIIPTGIVSSFFPKANPSREREFPEQNWHPTVPLKSGQADSKRQQQKSLPATQNASGSGTAKDAGQSRPIVPGNASRMAEAPSLTPEVDMPDSVEPMTTHPQENSSEQPPPSDKPPRKRKNANITAKVPPQDSTTEPKVTAPTRATEAIEGARILQTSYMIERDPGLRAEAIAHYGSRCCVCDFSFDEAFGPELGRGYIEVHHLKSVASGERKTNAHTDLAPLCANCHAMADRLTRTDLILPTTIADLRARLKSGRSRA